MTTATTVRRCDLTPRLRQALALARPDQDLRDHWHGATLNGLIRRGLARRRFPYRAGRTSDDWEVVLTDAGARLRLELRERVDRKLADHGFTHAHVSGLNLYVNPDEGGTCTLRAAMRETGVTW